MRSRTVSQSTEDSKRHIRCKVRRYEESKGCSSRLDNSPGQGAESSAFSECQDNPRLPPSHHWRSSLPGWRRLERSRVHFTFLIFRVMPSYLYRIRAKLSSGEMAVRGDQWPLLVYAKQVFDPEEPWDGLLRSKLLVWVRTRSPPSVGYSLRSLHAGL